MQVPAEHDGERLDRVLTDLVESASRARVQEWIKGGHVSVDGEAVRKPRHGVKTGTQLVVDLPSVPEEDMRRDPGLGLTVVHEDEAFCVIDKPAGIVAHKNRAHQTGSVSDLAVERWGPLPSFEDADRPGIVHRLDRDTSGLMVLARTQAALDDLRRQFAERVVEKTYLALVYGNPRFDSDWIEAPIGLDPKGRDRRSVVEEGQGKTASTFYETKQRFGDLALVACYPKTGRTHQIRVHLLHIGHPVWCDGLYKPRSGRPVNLPAEAPVIERQALHAHALKLNHPVTKEPVEFTSPLPPDFAALVEWLAAR